MPNPPRMRTIRNLATEYRERDTRTAINEHYLRRLIASNAVPYVKSGKKFLINVDALEAYLTAGQVYRPNESQDKNMEDK